MYALRHRLFATGLLVDSEVQHFCSSKQLQQPSKLLQSHMPQSSRFKMCACAVRNNVVMVSCIQVQYFMQAGDEKLFSANGGLNKWYPDYVQNRNMLVKSKVYIVKK